MSADIKLVPPSSGCKKGCRGGPGCAFDLTAHVGPFGSDRPWEMYSFERIARTFLQGAGKKLHAKGWKDEEIDALFGSKVMRWALDGALGTDLAALGEDWANEQKKVIE